MSSSNGNRSGLNGAAPSFTAVSVSNYDYDADNDSSSPDARERRRELREDSYEDSPDSGEGFGAIRSSSTRPAVQGDDFAGQGGPVQLGNIAPGGPDGYGVPVASSSVQGQVNLTTAPAPVLLPSPLPNVFSMAPQPVFPVPSAPVQALLAAGPQHVDMTVERTRLNAHPDAPAFLRHTFMHPATPAEWFNIVLPFIMGFIFTFNDSTDLYHGAAMWGSVRLPQLHNFIARVNFPRFHWFSGIAHNRHHNPYLQMIASLNSLRELTFRMHTAGTTTSIFGEKEMIELERTDPVRAAERRSRSLQEVINHYEMNGIFSCPSLRHICIEYIDSDIICSRMRTNPALVLRELQQYIIQGFRQMNLVVYVELVQVV